MHFELITTYLSASEKKVLSFGELGLVRVNMGKINNYYDNLHLLSSVTLVL